MSIGFIVRRVRLADVTCATRNESTITSPCSGSNDRIPTEDIFGGHAFGSLSLLVIVRLVLVDFHRWNLLFYTGKVRSDKRFQGHARAGWTLLIWIFLWI